MYRTNMTDMNLDLSRLCHAAHKLYERQFPPETLLY